MNVSVLGCSGGIGKGRRTTSLLVNDDILIDAGTGVCDLPLERLQKIRHVFVTHSHLDHVAAVPLLVDTIFDVLETPLTVYGRPETLAALREHIFNDVIWPDFGRIPHKHRPVLRYHAMESGETRTLGTCTVQMVPVAHSVPAAGYRVQCNGRAFAFSGDTTTNDGFWDALNQHDVLDLLIVESGFPDRELALSKLACHYTPQLLREDLGKLRHQPTVWLSHLKPGAEDEIVRECRQHIPWLELEALRGGEVFSF